MIAEDYRIKRSSLLTLSAHHERLFQVNMESLRFHFLGRIIHLNTYTVVYKVYLKSSKSI